MKDQIANHARDWLTTLLAGLGITFAAHEWLGGILLALAGGAFAMRMDPEKDERELWVVLLGAFIAAHVAGAVTSRYLPGFPVQIVMLGAGFLSRRLTRMAFNLVARVESRADEIGDRVIDRIIPDKSDKE